MNKKMLFLCLCAAGMSEEVSSAASLRSTGNRLATSARNYYRKVLTNAASAQQTLQRGKQWTQQHPGILSGALASGATLGTYYAINQAALRAENAAMREMMAAEIEELGQELDALTVADVLANNVAQQFGYQNVEALDTALALLNKRYKTRKFSEDWYSANNAGQRALLLSLGAEAKEKLLAEQEAIATQAIKELFAKENMKKASEELKAIFNVITTGPQQNKPREKELAKAVAEVGSRLGIFAQALNDERSAIEETIETVGVVDLGNVLLQISQEWGISQNDILRIFLGLIESYKAAARQ